MIKPIENSYWVLPGVLLAGEYPRNKDELSSVEKINALLDAGVKAFIDLTEEKDGLEAYSFMLKNAASHNRFPIQDYSIPEAPGKVSAILDVIDSNIEQGNLVYVHCWGGIGRTGVIIGCWLVRHGFSGETALALLRKLWKQCPKSKFKNSPENPSQENYILKWKS
ncbi:MAG: dual specificity protein phosphatase family protein [Candidatus Riflebacteria bacterium]|nr:dual specificity protein phosphatase family protein [Candidatus Riflebacteria bacterium]